MYNKLIADRRICVFPRFCKQTNWLISFSLIDGYINRSQIKVCSGSEKIPGKDANIINTGYLFTVALPFVWNFFFSRRWQEIGGSFNVRRCLENIHTAPTSFSPILLAVNGSKIEILKIQRKSRGMCLNAACLMQCVMFSSITHTVLLVVITTISP